MDYLNSPHTLFSLPKSHNLVSQKSWATPITSRPKERRGKLRFPLELPVRYRIRARGGRVADVSAGKTINIASGGIWFSTQYPLPAGTSVELTIDWPALLDESIQMQLRIHGKVIRSTAQAAAVSLDRYEFRTRGWLTPIRLHHGGTAPTF